MHEVYQEPFATTELNNGIAKKCFNDYKLHGIFSGRKYARDVPRRGWRQLLGLVAEFGPRV